MRANMCMRIGWGGVAAVGVVLCAQLCVAAATTGLKNPYLQVLDSPLVTSSPGFHVDNFESGALNDPGVTLTTLNGSSVYNGFSVDADDGTIDGSGAGGKSLDVITSFGQSEAKFTFNNGVLGGYPKSAAVAVTYCVGAGSMVFTVYDPSNAVSGTYTINAPNVSASTYDDFLLWGSDPGGISAIDVTYNNAFTSMYLDHVQYDMLNTVPVPEPSALLLCVVGAGMLMLRCRKPF